MYFTQFSIEVVVAIIIFVLLDAWLEKEAIFCDYFLYYFSLNGILIKS